MFISDFGCHLLMICMPFAIDQDPLVEDPPHLPVTPQANATSSTSNQQSSPAVLYTGQETQLAIVPMDDDDFSDHETVTSKYSSKTKRNIEKFERIDRIAGVRV